MYTDTHTHALSSERDFLLKLSFFSTDAAFHPFDTFFSSYPSSLQMQHFILLIIPYERLLDNLALTSYLINQTPRCLPSHPLYLTPLCTLFCVYVCACAHVFLKSYYSHSSLWHMIHHPSPSLSHQWYQHLDEGLHRRFFTVLSFLGARQEECTQRLCCRHFEC